MKSRTLTQSGSAFLDCVRFATAIFVFLGHIVFIPGSARFLHLAHIAVCIFFVLSGFVIRMIVVNRAGTIGAFFIDRASRIYSVVIPALILTILCEALARHVDPITYAQFAAPFSWSQVPLQLLANLTSMAQNWGYEINPLSNSPFWSLSFECIYYVLFALFFYSVGKPCTRRTVMFLIAALVMLVAGPSIVLLFPTWLIGCLLYDVYSWLNHKPYAFSLTSALLATVSGLALFFRHAIAHLMFVTDFSHRTFWLLHLVTPVMRARFSDTTGYIPWLSRFSFSFYVAAILVFFFMLWSLVTLDRFLPQIHPRIARTLRWIAEGTFALYLLHLPLLILIATLFHGHPKFPVLWAIGVVVLCILLSRFSDNLKLSLRTWLRRTFNSQIPAC